MAYPHLLSPMRCGALHLNNRVWMAPLTRSRAAQPGDVPSELNAEYYAQRASAGLIVSEATQISQQGQGYAWTPGIYTEQQEAGWQRVVQAVHAAGGKIVLQLWHVGRISHPLLQENGAAPVAPSAITANAQCFVVQPDGTPANVPTASPRALDSSELPAIAQDYAAAAARAKRAGFDGVEIHMANGYLLDQFLCTGSNQRTDDYGGNIENRARFPLEVLDAVVAVWGPERVGVRLSPFGTFNDMQDREAEAMAVYLARASQEREIAYLHIAEPDWAGGPTLSDTFRDSLRHEFSGSLVWTGGYDAQRADEMIQKGLADAVGFGRPYIANPDLVNRFAHQAPLNAPDANTFYGGGAVGYTDYPCWQPS